MTYRRSGVAAALAVLLALVSTSAWTQDCDGNGVGDAVELAGRDCDDNGVLDSCDLEVPDVRFEEWLTAPALAWATVLADVNADGVDEIVVLGPRSMALRVSEQGELVTLWQNAPPPLRPNLPSVEGADLTGDGRDDVAFLLDGMLFVMEATPGGLLASRLLVQGLAPDAQFVTADLNSDGRADIISYSLTGGQQRLAIALSVDGGGFADLQFTTFTVAGSPHLATGDMDADGDLDVVVAGSSRTVNVFLNDGTGRVSATRTLEVDGRFVGPGFDVGDFDGDGDADLVGHAGGEVRLVVNDGLQSFTSVRLGGQDAPITRTRAVVFAADEPLGVLVTASPVGCPVVNVLALSSNGRQPIFQRDGSLLRSSLPVALAGDLDTDGQLETAVLDQNAGEVVVYRRVRDRSVDCNGNGVLDRCEDSGDCDHDGHLDECEIAAADCNSNGVPDDCELDCDANGIPDDCDLAGEAEDCNANGILDRCERRVEDLRYDVPLHECALVDGATDCNDNGVPDSIDASALLRFGASLGISLPNRPVALTAADFDGDGDEDLAVAFLSNQCQRSFGGLWIYQNIGGTFVRLRKIEHERSILALCSGDFNGDGTMDIVASTVESLLSYDNDGRGEFAVGAEHAVNRVSGLQAIDVDGNGVDDVVTARVVQGRALVFFGAPGVSLQSVVSAGVSGSNVTAGAGDLDGDGIAELAVSADRTGQLQIEKFISVDKFETVATVAYGGFAPAGVAVTDLDDDGRADIVLTHGRFVERPANAYTLFWNQGNQFTANTVLLTPNVGPPFVDDFDGDRRPDIGCIGTWPYAFSDDTQSFVSVLMHNRGGRQFGAPVYADLGRGPGRRVPAITDVDSDGSPEIVIGIGSSSSHSSQLRIVSPRAGTNFMHVVAGVSLGRIGTLNVRDINADGLVDVLVSEQGGSRVAYLKATAAGDFEAPQHLQVRARLFDLAAADLDGDGDVDLAATTESGVAIALAGSPAVFSPQPFVVAEQFALAHRVMLADVNNDRRPDLILTGASQLEIGLNQGNGAFTSSGFVRLGAPVASLAAGDLNGDGFVDIVTANTQGVRDNVSILLSNGDGTLRAPRNFPAGVGARDVETGDIDADGNLDVIVANSTSSTLSLLYGRGDGSFEAQEELPAQFALAVELIDLTGNGLLELCWSSLDGVFAHEWQVDRWSPLRRLSGLHGGILTSSDVDRDGDVDIALQYFGERNDGVFLILNAGEERWGDVDGDGALDACEEAGIPFVRGDVNADGKRDVTDGVGVLLYLFAAGAVPDCLRASDANDSGTVNIVDALFLLTFLFGGGPVPPQPGPGCGLEFTVDELGCESFSHCEG